MTTVSGKQSLGQRDTQEDAYRIVRQSEQDPNADVLILLADGMGGHAGGEVASNLALEAFEHHFSNVSKNPKPRQRLKEALLAANAAVAKRVKEEPALKGMGCTLIAALKIGDRLLWASVGDSILFLYRNEKLRRLNVDHSLYGELLEMVKDGKITQAEADSHPRRNALRSAIMGETVALIDVNGVELQPGDIVVLASDGLETLSDAEIAQIVGADPKADVRAMSSDLLNAVDERARPKQDNTTVTVYRHEQEGMSGFYRDSRWKLGAGSTATSSNSVVRPMLIGAATALGILALAFMIWKIGFATTEVVDEPEVETPQLDTVPVDRSEGGIADDGVGGDGIVEPETTDPESDGTGAISDEPDADAEQVPEGDPDAEIEPDPSDEDPATEPEQAPDSETSDTGEENTEAAPSTEPDTGTSENPDTSDDFEAGDGVQPETQ